jgi:hypothetical protein
MKRRLTLICLAIAAPVFAGPGVPGPAYFAGTYERVGRDSASPPRFVDDQVTITARGTGLRLQDCAGSDTKMIFFPTMDGENVILGQTDGADFACLFHNNGANRPILTCRADAGGVFTLWPVTTDTAPLQCG